MTDKTTMIALLVAVIVCPNGQQLTTWGPWPWADPCPQLEAFTRYTSRCGVRSTSGQPIVTGLEPCEDIGDQPDGK
jgi:hypothetical protein